MKVKIMSGVLIFSLALNLAVIGTFVFKRFLRPEAHFHPRDMIGRMPFLRDMEIDDAKREKIIELFKAFHETNRETREQIRALEDQLFEILQDESTDLDQAHKIMDKIGEKRLELGKNALIQLVKAKSFLSPRQQDHFYRMLIRQRPNPGRLPSAEIFKERERQMRNQWDKIKETRNAKRD